MHFSHPDAANSLGKFSSAFIGRTRFGGNNEVREKEDSRPCNEAAKRCSFLAGGAKPADGSGDFARHNNGRVRAKVTNNATVEEMRQHLLSLYEGVSVSHSFVLGASCQ